MPGRILNAPEREYHPFEYFSECPHCQKECEQVYWHKNAIKAWSLATGPRTSDGKSATAKNLEGHPTQEEAMRTRFNAMQHGLSARTATYFPAKPDGYAFCSSCDVDRTFCKTQPACAKKTELFMLHHAAFEQKNPRHLLGIYADFQASIFAVLQEILRTIVADGVKITTPEFSFDKDGNCLVARYSYHDENGVYREGIINKIEANPLFKPLYELMSRTGLTMSDMGMTQKSIEAEEGAMGKLVHETMRQENAEEYQAKQLTLMNRMADMIQRANKSTDTDPILLEYQNEGNR
ncbi:MAG: hypothetical protein PHF58_13480 [Methylotenera sp.]|nr:hypothetical protein [Methylotenera sp.]